MSKILSTIMILFSSTCFAQNANQETWDDELLTSILANENECVHHYNEEKIYLNPDKIHPTSQGIYLNLNENEFIFVPCLNSDNQGCYVQCGAGGFNVNPKSTCPGCGQQYLMGGCDNTKCSEFKKREQRRDDYKREKEQRMEEKRREKEQKRERKSKKN